MPVPIPQEEYCKLARHVSKSGRAELTSGRRTGYCTNQDLETTKRSRGEQGVSGILNEEDRATPHYVYRWIPQEQTVVTTSQNEATESWKVRG